MELDVQQRGAARAALHLRETGERAQNLQPAFDRIGTQLQRSEALWFRTHGAGRWPPLAAATEEQKGAEGQGHEPLVATGALRRSLLRRSAVEKTRTSVGLVTDVHYARFHEYGTRTMPARPPLVPLTPQMRDAACEEIRRHVLGAYR